MTSDEVQKLPLGLYLIFWKESSGGGSSLASVGNNASGRRWIAPINWVKFFTGPNEELRHIWESVESAKQLYPGPNTPAAALARAILAGDESAIPALIDHAQERYQHEAGQRCWWDRLPTDICPKHGKTLGECPFPNTTVDTTFSQALTACLGAIDPPPCCPVPTSVTVTTD